MQQHHGYPLGAANSGHVQNRRQHCSCTAPSISALLQKVEIARLSIAVLKERGTNSCVVIVDNSCKYTCKNTMQTRNQAEAITLVMKAGLLHLSKELVLDCDSSIYGAALDLL